MDVANELLDAIDILVNQTTNNKFTQIYSGICKSVVDSSTCVMTVNGKDNNVTFYGVRPKTGNIYRVFIPNGNMSMAFIVTIPTTYGEVGAAPAGYGLGGNAKFITSGDLNDYKNCGWYAWDEGVSNAPFAYGSCIILNKGSSWIAHQIAIAGYGQNICIRRYLTPTDTWDAWEWVNPPMQPGAEYRTTERYAGKPVYKKLINVGSIGANSSITVRDYASNVGDIVTYDLYSYYAKRAETRTDSLYVAEARPNYFVIGNTSKSYVYESSRLLVAYTKTTD